MKVGRCDLLLLDSDVDGKHAGGPRAHHEPLRRRRAHAHPPRATARRRRLSRLKSDGNHAGRLAHERRPQRFCRP
jgi:hypothetical protein